MNADGLFQEAKSKRFGLLSISTQGRSLHSTKWANFVESRLLDRRSNGCFDSDIGGGFTDNGTKTGSTGGAVF